MAKELFPEEIIEDTSQVNFSKHSVQTKIIYSSTLLFIVAVIAALSFIKTDVSVKSRGVIQPISDRNKLTTMSGGEIEKLYIKNDDHVTFGQEVAEISAPILTEKIHFNESRRQKLSEYLLDLRKLHDIDSTDNLNARDMKTSKYSQSYLQFQQQAQRKVKKIKNARQQYSRNNKLYKQDFISEAKYEKSLLNLQIANSNWHILLDQQKSKWQADQVKYRDELDQLNTKLEQFKEKKKHHVIKAPVSGTIQNMKGIYKGSFVSPNQTLAEISPDTDLVAECYVAPKDIGLIKKGMNANLQVSAFDYNQWGFLKAKVQQISNDVTIVNNRPVFKVRSKLNKNYLTLENGYRGKLKKGMTIQARFTIARRSLFQLLYDNIDDWLNPKWDRPKQNNENQKQVYQTSF